MKFKPEAEAKNTKDIPDAEAGEYRMRIASYSPEVTTSKWSGAIVEFVTVDGTAKISEFINEKGAWKFGRLAKAIGDDARKEYHETDSSGYSLFDPAKFIGRELTVEVEDGYDRTRVCGISANPKESSVGDPQNLDDGRHDDGANDDSDIPF